MILYDSAKSTINRAFCRKLDEYFIILLETKLSKYGILMIKKMKRYEKTAEVFLW